MMVFIHSLFHEMRYKKPVHLRCKNFQAQYEW